MKKRIKDLRLNDTVYKQSGGQVSEFIVSSISRNKLIIDQGSRYGSETFEMKEEDLTRFNFEVGHWKYKFFLSRIDALKSAREYLDKNLEGIFSKQQDFLKSIQEANSEIRVIDAEIAEELKTK